MWCKSVELYLECTFGYFFLQKFSIINKSTFQIKMVKYKKVIIVIQISHFIGKGAGVSCEKRSPIIKFSKTRRRVNKR